MRFLESEDERDIREGDYEAEGTVAILLNDAGQVLLQLRDDRPDVRFPGHWNMPGGMLEPGETLEEALRRELWEELAYRVGEVEKYGVAISPYRTLIHVFVARIHEPVEKLVLGEGQAIRYFDGDEVPRLKMPPHTQEALLHLYASASAVPTRHGCEHPGIG